MELLCLYVVWYWTRLFEIRNETVSLAAGLVFTRDFKENIGCTRSLCTPHMWKRILGMHSAI